MLAGDAAGRTVGGRPASVELARREGAIRFRDAAYSQQRRKSRTCRSRGVDESNC